MLVLQILLHRSISLLGSMLLSLPFSHLDCDMLILCHIQDFCAQVAEGWTREQKDKCLDETEKAFSVGVGLPAPVCRWILTVSFHAKNLLYHCLLYCWLCGSLVHDDMLLIGYCCSIVKLCCSAPAGFFATCEHEEEKTAVWMDYDMPAACHVW